MRSCVKIAAIWRCRILQLFLLVGVADVSLDLQRKRAGRARIGKTLLGIGGDSRSCQSLDPFVGCSHVSL
jgi:hypothetical protein